MKLFTAFVSCAYLTVCCALKKAEKAALSGSQPVRVELANLVAAIENGYNATQALASAERITKLLRADVALHAIHLSGTMEQQASQRIPHLSGTLEQEAEAKAVDLHAGNSTQLPGSLCLFDDRLFALTPQSKQELALELESATMKEAVPWVQSGGSWICAMENEICQCGGQVVMVDVDHSAWSTILDARLTNNAAMCNLASFGNVDFKPGVAKQCECRHAPQDFHLHKRLTSKSYLQEAWIFLLRLLGRGFLLPAGTGDKTYSGIQNWGARHNPQNMPLVLERVWIELYMKKIVQPSTTGLNRCLEWGDPSRPGSGFNYLNMMPQCTDKVDIQFDPVFRGEKSLSIEGNIIYSDVENLANVLTVQGDTVERRMGIIFATQVFEHLAHPQYAMQQMFASLLPGGAIAMTAPQQAQFHLVPHDYFRYTKEGVLQLLQDAGFCVPAWGFAGGGDFIFDIARDAGLQVQDFPNEEILGAFQVGYDKVSDAAITIHALGYKPPHAACQSALPKLS